MGFSKFNGRFPASAVHNDNAKDINVLDVVIGRK